MRYWKVWKQSILHFFFPSLCALCKQALLIQEQVLCIACEQKLPFTHYHALYNNETSIRLAGRFPFQQATSLFYFTQGSAVQELMHILKYKNHPEIGTYFGSLLGKQLRNEANFQSIEAIVAVPLHFKKEQQRGYNQSNLIAAACAEAMGVPFYSKALVRKRFTQTQTLKTRSERVDNMEAAFFVNNTNLFVNKHLLIMDDVLTTGATIEACALQLLKIPGTQISIATIGVVIS